MNSSIEQLKLYTIDDAFIKDLHDNIDSRVFNNNDPAYNHARKYLGVLIKLVLFHIMRLYRLPRIQIT